MRKEYGTAGLNVLLSVIVMLFVIGLIVMVFALMGGELTEASYQTTSGSADNETLTTVTEAGEDLSVSTLRSVGCTINIVTNATDGVVIDAGNYTQTGCNLAFSGDVNFNNTDWNVTYDYSYEADTVASTTINETGSSIATVTSWFPIIIVITAMIVLILLTVIIITAIRGSGLVASA